jgi:hypothetical protein
LNFWRTVAALHEGSWFIKETHKRHTPVALYAVAGAAVVMMRVWLRAKDTRLWPHWVNAIGKKCRSKPGAGDYFWENALSNGASSAKITRRNFRYWLENFYSPFASLKRGLELAGTLIKISAIKQQQNRAY